MSRRIPQETVRPSQPIVIPPNYGTKIWYVYASTPVLMSKPRAIQHFAIGISEHKDMNNATLYCVGPQAELGSCGKDVKRQFTVVQVGIMEGRYMPIFENIMRRLDTDDEDFENAIRSGLPVIQSFYRCLYYFQKKLLGLYNHGIVKWDLHYLKLAVHANGSYANELDAEFNRDTGMTWTQYPLAVIKELEINRSVLKARI
ncbi:hypothetical protein BD410DRAFT_842277 [Rickenella mellea]|uniref:Uncharacterized protein n=1 Tax=Rickenella mellea TaxID=50990 RepID=A0A4Y7PX55_9AGAM|nr:hypothetical protein BD410DRAFT_842277 [Rickenella mellea]